MSFCDYAQTHECSLLRYVPLTATCGCVERTRHACVQVSKFLGNAVIAAGIFDSDSVTDTAVAEISNLKTLVAILLTVADILIFCDFGSLLAPTFAQILAYSLRMLELNPKLCSAWTLHVVCVVINFVTAFYDPKRGHYIYNCERIAIAYLKGFAVVGRVSLMSLLFVVVVVVVVGGGRGRGRGGRGVGVLSSRC